MNLVGWFSEVWPNVQKRYRVIGQYAALRQSPMLLTDIALRGGVFSVMPRTPGDAFGDGINEGRRQLALEIFKLAQVEPGELYALIEKKPSTAAGAKP